MTPKTTVIVMAQGEGSRWDLQRYRLPHVPFKHLALIGNETLIGRTARMLRERRVGRVIVVGYEEFRASIEPSELFIQKSTGPLLDGIVATHEFWKTDRVIFLLGDVLFSHAAMQTILDDESQIMFFGRTGPNKITGKQAPELFGFNMRRLTFPSVTHHCHWMNARGRKIRYPPKLWALNRMMGGLEHYEPLVSIELITEINDYTDDLDSPEEYKHFWPQMVLEALKEDLL